MTDTPDVIPETESMHVLFLCTHNSSPSQMAEGLLRARGGKRYMVFGTEEERLAVFRQVRDAIAARIDVFLACENEGTVA